MATSMNHESYFTWARFVRTMLVQFAVVGALFVYWTFASSERRAAHLAVVAVVVWIAGAFAFRWNQLRALERKGQLTSTEFQANAFEYLRGSNWHWRLTIGGACAIAIAIILTDTLVGAS